MMDMGDSRSIAARATSAAGFPPQLMRAAAVMRMSGASLAEFLRNHNNPCLAVGGLPPPLSIDSSDIRDLLRLRRREMPPPMDGELVDGLIECVGDDGLLDIPDDWLAGVSKPRMASAIAYLQSIAPPGVAARDWGECMELQLAATPESAARTAARQLVAEHLPWLLRKRWDKLPKRRLAAAAPALEKLLPSPADEHRPAAAARLPDVAYVKRRGLWRAQAGDGLNITVACRAGRDGETTTAATRGEAAALAAAVRARRRWLLTVAQLAADRQVAFFGGGAAALRPFPLSEAAAALSVSAAFLSHIVSGKSAIFAGGGFPLKYLFPRRGKSVAGAAVQQIIKSMIDTENPRRPLSDAALCRNLRERGIPLARRTVGKHRHLAGFSNAALRKPFPTTQDRKFYAN